MSNSSGVSSSIISVSIMSNTSSTPFTESPLVSSASSSASPSSATTSPVTPTTNNETPSVSPASSSAGTYPSVTSSLVSSVASAISLQSTSGATATGSTNFTSFTAQTSTSNGQTQAISSAPISVAGIPNVIVSEPQPTSIGASTQSSGALPTHTQIGTASIGNSFFDNRGAVAGTFVAVAVFFVAIFACLFVAWRRRLRRRKRDTLLETINRRLQDKPYSHPAMSVISPGTVSFAPTYMSNVMLTAGVPEPGTIDRTGPPNNSPSSKYFAMDHNSRDLTRLAITTTSRIDSPEPSSTLSSPSIYPPSLPPMETENDVTRPTPIQPPARSVTPPPRPPRRRRPPLPNHAEAAMTPSSSRTLLSFDTALPPASYLPDVSPTHGSVRNARHSLLKRSELQLLTPPSSISDHSRMDSRSRGTIGVARVLNHPTDV